MWQLDDEVTFCSQCEQKFTLFFRRHHCRKCGRVVCGECSDNFVSYSGLDFQVISHAGLASIAPYDVYRTCDDCLVEVRRMRDTQTALPPALTDPVGALLDPLVAQDAHQQASAATDNVSDSDLCPVCSRNLKRLFRKTASGRDELESLKESHINECLVAFDFNDDHNLRFSSPGASHTRNKMLVYNMPPIPCPAFESIAGSCSSPAPISGALCQEKAQPDAIDNECVICLEDLVPGDKVGRLECLCVFHYKCIRDWFGKKGSGECPIHFLHK